MLSPADRRGCNLNWLAVELGFRDIADMSRKIAGIDDRGYTLLVSWKDGKRRVISAPRDWLKDLQRRANRGVLAQLPVSDFAFNAEGRGAIANAITHVGQPYMTAMDVENCFPSTSVAMVAHAFRDLGLTVSVSGTLTRLTTFHGCLPQGSPTSDSVLNLVFRPIDAELSEIAAQYDARYSRFSDDLTFSAGRPLQGLDRKVARVLHGFGYRSNSAKRHVWGPHHRHVVTGVAVNSRPKPTPRFLWWLSRELDRYESGISDLTETQIRSTINWANDVDITIGAAYSARFEKAVKSGKRVS